MPQVACISFLSGGIDSWIHSHLPTRKTHTFKYRFPLNTNIKRSMNSRKILMKFPSQIEKKGGFDNSIALCKIGSHWPCGVGPGKGRANCFLVRPWGILPTQDEVIQGQSRKGMRTYRRLSRVKQALGWVTGQRALWISRTVDQGLLPISCTGTPWDLLTGHYAYDVWAL